VGRRLDASFDLVTSRGHVIHASTATRRLVPAATHDCIRQAPPKAKTPFSLFREQGLPNTRIMVKNSVPMSPAQKGNAQAAKRRESPKAEYL
jgi:hypothetical protein